MRIAIDAMGGDHAPQANVEGALQAAQEWKDTEIVLVGNSRVLEPLIPNKPANLSVVHAEEKIEAEDEPVKAVRRKKDSSMVVAGKMVRQGEIDAMISSGNTGALLATGLLAIGRMKGIERAALAPMMPTMDGQGVLALDLGANMDATAENLLQYAIMGSIYRQKAHDMPRPRVGLLSVGTEAMKGNELTKAAYPLLEQAPVHFIGNVEARDVLHGNCDVLVCDGFAGNIMLKAMEGAAGAIFTELKQQFTKTLWSKLAAAVLKKGLVEFKNKMDYKEHAAALLLGINGLCFKCHGSSDAKAIKNAVRVARTAVKNELVTAISTEIGKLRPADEAEAASGRPVQTNLAGSEL